MNSNDILPEMFLQKDLQGIIDAVYLRLWALFNFGVASKV
jgi:hypothetical protein